MTETIDTDLVEIKRRAPALIKDEKGRERTENGRWSSRAMAEYVSRHPEIFHTGTSLCRVANERATEANVEKRRKCLSEIADIMLELGFPAVLEWGGGKVVNGNKVTADRKIVAVARYNPQDEYHQSLMAAEIGRRRLCADGKAEKLQSLVAALPRQIP